MSDLLSLAVLDPGKWAPNTYKRLASFICDNGKYSQNYDSKSPPYAVFDWDQTCIFNDTEEHLFHFQILNLLFKTTPEMFAEAVRKDIPEANFVQRNTAGEPVNIDKIAADLDSDYKFLYTHYISGKKTGLNEIRSTEQFKDFRAKLVYLFEAVGATFHGDISYPWVLYLLSGMTPGEVAEIAERSNDAGLHDDLSSFCLRSSASLPGNAGVIEVCGNKRGLRLIPEISNLMNVLRSSGIDVYVCSASLEEVVRVFAGLPKYGYNVLRENVIGMRLKQENGVYVPGLDPQWVQTQRQGKTEAIRRVLVQKYGHGPALVCGDSQGDYFMATDFTDTQLVLIMNKLKNDDFSKLGVRAMEQKGNADAKYVLQGFDENTGQFRPDEATIPLGENSPRPHAREVLKTE